MKLLKFRVDDWFLTSTTWIVIVCIVVHLQLHFLPWEAKLWLSFRPYGFIENWEFIQLFTCLFVHFNLTHLLGNCAALLVLGEDIKKKQLTSSANVFYMFLAGGVVPLLTTFMVCYFVDPQFPAEFCIMGASGGVYTLLSYVITAKGLYRRCITKYLTLLVLGIDFSIAFFSFGVLTWYIHLTGFILGRYFALAQRRLRKVS